MTYKRKFNIEQIKDYKESTYLGHTRYDFKIGKNECVIVKPDKPVPDQRWVWKAEFFEAFPTFERVMLNKGWWVAYMNVGNTFGCPSAMKRFDVFYREMTKKYGFHKKPVLEGISRGGLYVYNWAAKNTDKVGMIFGDNPVCDFKSWPAGKGNGPGCKNNWKLLLKCYNFKSEQEALEWKGNPIDNLVPIINAGIPLVHTFGDADEIVPWDENTGVLASRIESLGSKIKLFPKPGCKHHPHGLKVPGAFADWVQANTLND